MTDETMHVPTPLFRDELERAVVRALRLEQQLERRKRASRTRWMRSAAVVLVSAALGASAGIASGQIRDGARRDSLLEAARADASLVALRLNLARERLNDVKRKYDVGVADAASLADADAEVRAMEAQAMRARYNIEEITVAAQPPRDDLNAPVIDGRDFVKDRIRLELLVAQQRLTAAEAAYTEVERRARVGAAGELASLEAGMEVARARSAMAVLAQRLTLRQEYLERGTPVDQLLARLADTQLRQDVDLAQRELGLARERASLVERRRAAGVVSEVDVLKAKLEIQLREVELRQLMLRLKQQPR